jgi:outer membrane biosynthesis protein TonB
MRSAWVFTSPLIPILISISVASGCAATNTPSDRAAAAILVAPPMITIFRDINDWYPDASKRANETGRVVLHFAVSPAGVSEEPFTLDEKESTTYPRLIEAAQRMFHGTKFQSGPGYKRLLTASFVFEIKPCGKLSQAAVLDYAFSLCVSPLNPGPTISY